MTDTVTVQKNLPIWVLENNGIIEDWSFSRERLSKALARKHPLEGVKCRILQPLAGAKLERGKPIAPKGFLIIFKPPVTQSSKGGRHIAIKNPARLARIAPDAFKGGIRSNLCMRSNFPTKEKKRLKG